MSKLWFVAALALATHPAATHPAATHPAATHPAATHPAVAHPAVAHPAVAHPAAAHPAAAIPAAIPAAVPGEGHGDVAWFAGTFEEALAESAKTKKILFLNFWTKDCPWCKRLDLQTFTSPPVVEAARAFVCFPVEVDSAKGRPVAERYQITGWPALVFAEPDGSLRERLAGFKGPEQLVREFQRVQAGVGLFGEVEKRAAANPKDALARLDLVLRLRQIHDPRWSTEMAAARELVARGEGFDPKSPDERFQVARRMRMCGDTKGYDEQIAAIRELDPEGRSLPLRHLALQEILRKVESRMPRQGTVDVAPVQAFLVDEQHAAVRFEGWASLHEMATRRAVSVEQRLQVRELARAAWKDCPADRTADFGRQVAMEMLAYAMELPAEDVDFAIELATRSSQAAPRSVDHLETLADCLAMAGRSAEAAAALDRALAIEPGRASLLAKREKLRH